MDGEMENTMEFLLIALFCFFNARIVKVKGRRTGGIIGITIALSLGLGLIASTILTLIRFPFSELAAAAESGSNAASQMSNMISQFIDSALKDPLFIYIPYIAVVVGGLISLLIARAYKPVDYTKWSNGNNFWDNRNNDNSWDPRNNQNNNNTWNNQSNGSTWNNQSNGSTWNNQNTGNFGNANAAYNDIPMGKSMDSFEANKENLISSPCTICVIRDPSTTKTEELFTVSINGHPVCRLGNNTYANFMTNEKQNTVTARDGSGMSLKKPITFLAMEGGFVEIHIKGDSFVPEKTVGKRPKKEEA